MRKELNVFPATPYSRITHSFVSKNLNIIYSKNTQTTPQIYCNAIRLENLHNYHQKFIYIIVLPIMDLCQTRCKDCPYFVCVHLSLDFYSAWRVVENFAFHAGKHIPGFLAGG